MPSSRPLLDPTSSPESFRRIRKLAVISLPVAAERTGIPRPTLNNFELDKLTLPVRHRVSYARVLSAAIADRVAELRKIGALQVEQGEQIAT